MTWLLVATGFTGALTLVFLVRLALQRYRPGPAIEAQFPPDDCMEPVVRLVRRARRQVQLLAGSLSSSGLSQALVDAKLRGVQVEIILGAACAADPASDFAFLVDQNLAPNVLDRAQPALRQCLLIVDAEAVAVGPAFSEEAQDKQSGLTLILAGQPDLARRCAEQFASQRGNSKPVTEAVSAEKSSAKPRLVKPRQPGEATPSLASATDDKPRLRILAEEPSPTSP